LYTTNEAIATNAHRSPQKYTRAHVIVIVVSRERTRVTVSHAIVAAEIPEDWVHLPGRDLRKSAMEGYSKALTTPKATPQVPLTILESFEISALSMHMRMTIRTRMYIPRSCSSWNAGIEYTTTQTHPVVQTMKNLWRPVLGNQAHTAMIVITISTTII